MKKLLSIILSVTMMTTIMGSIVFAEEISSKTVSVANDKDTIIKNYQKAIMDLKLKSDGISVINDNSNITISQIQTNAVSALNKAGYEAYNVTPQTFESVENTLNTDLEEAGLSPEYSYIILIEGEENDSTITPRSSVSSSFTHTYNGTTYTLRWMTVYATDDPDMGKADDVSVLSSSATSVIQNCLDAAISTYISSVSKTLGTVASICGLSISNFAPSQTATMRLNGATNWTRRYTQVWSDYYSAWVYGCCVEEVTAFSYMTGSYYDANTNRYMNVPEDEKYDTRYSSKFYDDQWRKDYAVIGYLGTTIYDTVGDVVYKYNGSTKITHRHNF